MSGSWALLHSDVQTRNGNTMDPETLLGLLVLGGSLVYFQLKHFIADYLLQGEFMLRKFSPGWEFFLPLLSHVGVHGAGTYLYLMILGVGPQYYWLVLADMLIHFTMDRLKAGPKYMGRWKPLTMVEYTTFKQHMVEDEEVKGKRYLHAREKLSNNKFFWWSLGLDQMVHHLTHYGIIFYVLVN